LEEAWNPRLLSLNRGDVEKDSLVADLNLGIISYRVARGESGVGMPGLRRKVLVSLFEEIHTDLRGTPVVEQSGVRENMRIHRAWVRRGVLMNGTSEGSWQSAVCSGYRQPKVHLEWDPDFVEGQRQIRPHTLGLQTSIEGNSTQCGAF
jgi:hypothetical protein